MRKLPLYAWQKLEPTLFGPVYNEVWDRFYKQFKFLASMHPGDWPGIEEPTPSVTYSIAAIYNSGSAETFYAHFYETNEMFLEAFRSCTKEDEKLYALDWHHEAFWFYPYGSFENALSNEDNYYIAAGIEYEKRNFDAWEIPVIPDGDYYIFLAQDFRFGTFGHPWEQTICIFGQQLIDAVELNKPSYFEELRRKPNRVLDSQS